VNQYGNDNPALGRISGPEVPLDAYVFEATVLATL
jgi:hypothetical protein